MKENDFVVISFYRGAWCPYCNLELKALQNINDELKPIYESFGINISKSNGTKSFELPLVAVYVINKNKEIIFRFIDEDYTKRCEP